MRQKTEYISAKKVIDLKLIPWIKSIPTLTHLIRKESRKRNSRFPLKVIIKGEGHRSRYYIDKNSLKDIVKTVVKNRKSIIKV